ncbi:hypothetical protein K1D78_25560, partial [Escherichia coli]|nr:hypothetical protein [Escherichia coli]
LMEKARIGDANLLPLKPLGGSPNPKHLLKKKREVELGDMETSSSSDEDDTSYGTLTLQADSFPFIPRATTLPSRALAKTMNYTP